MRIILAVSLLLSLSVVNAQTHLSLKDVEPDEDYENIHIKKISDDKEQTTFIIWVKKNVKAHYHAVHSENIYILEGKGRMVVDGKEIEIKAGDYLNFAKGKVHAVLEVTSRRPLKVISVQSPQFLGKDRIFVEESK